MDKEKESEKMEKKQTFAEKQPKLNFLLGLILLIGIAIAAKVVDYKYNVKKYTSWMV